MEQFIIVYEYHLTKKDMDLNPKHVQHTDFMVKKMQALNNILVIRHETFNFLQTVSSNHA